MIHKYNDCNTYEKRKKNSYPVEEIKIILKIGFLYKYRF